MDNISKEHFSSWKKEEVTAALFDLMRNKLKLHEKEMLNPEIISSPKCQVELCKMLGYKTCIEDLLSLEASDLTGEENDSVA